MPAPAPAGARPRIGAGKRCPSCTAPLDGGPVRFRCEPCGRSVMAADLDTEYHPHPVPGPVPNPARAADDHEGRDRR
ncbi:hypothetical protein [Actinomadura montaniterrae]|uniref:Uncharacterized protein n=1 Tax=Actinomadura montaniterrae TaxID=1803903 RepID=A0A6L3VT44_9ACTN|nr:hypothetical protein [Actinomadura montaniterrae]KAB2380652.1 hypothetical protein F9B16_17260 [Actinomadura montaniterrae]KAB2386430.1 hypothetical protein F9B16_07095 [Actinomadura montaniterrae]